MRSRYKIIRHGGHVGQSGQAMTEFQICAAFVLVPLFLIIPLLGKYIDIKHASINAARYQAWEYTAWYNSADDHDIVDNFNAASIPYKSPGATSEESRHRLFSYIQEGDQALTISSNDSGGWKKKNRNPLWTDHGGNLLYSGGMNTTITTANNTPGFKIFGIDTGGIVSTIMNGLNLVFSAFGALLGIIPGNSGAGFSAINNEGYIRSSLGVPIATFPNAIDVHAGANSVDIQARAGVLSEGWNSGGTEHTYRQVSGAVPVTLLKELLKLPGLKQIWTVVSFLAPELTPCKPRFRNPLVGKEGSLWFGYVDSDTVHPDRLSGGGTHVCNDAGICRLEPVIPVSHSECIP